MSVIWHDLECGAYVEDLPVWLELAAAHGDPILELGAGTGRVTLELARRRHAVTALDRDAELLEALRVRASAERLPVRPVLADARDFRIRDRFALCIAPMQTIQLLGGPRGRRACLDCVRRHLLPGGVAAFAISSRLEPYELEPGAPTLPLPDIAEIDGFVYSSQPTAVREQPDGFVLVRRRERIGASGERITSEDTIGLDRLSAPQLEEEARHAGLEPRRRIEVAQTREYVGGEVVIAGV